MSNKGADEIKNYLFGEPSNRNGLSSSEGYRGRNTQRNNYQRDDRMPCPSCNRAIIPKVVFSQGTAVKSMCPFCGATIKHFEGYYLRIVSMIIGIPIFLYIASKVFF